MVVQTSKAREGKELAQVNTKRCCDKWTEDEDNQLRELSGTMPASQIGKIIGGRKKNGVNKRIQRLGLQNVARDKCESWSIDLIDNLKSYGPKMTANAFVDKFGVTINSTYNHAKKFKIKFLPCVEWTEDKIEVLRQCKTATEAAEKLGKNRRNVLARAKMLGIILAESKVAKEAQKKEPKPVIHSVKRTPVKKEAHKRPVREEKSRIEICPIHHCPVSDWQGHYERLGCRRSDAFREVA